MAHDLRAGHRPVLRCTAALGEPDPGHYRIEVHNWAGLPGTRVDLTLTHLNTAGEPGPAA